MEKIYIELQKGIRKIVIRDVIIINKVEDEKKETS